GLSTASREEEQVHSLAMGIARVRQTGEIQENEGQLKSAPLGRRDAKSLPQCACDRAIRHAERIEGVSVFFQKSDAALDPVGGHTGELQQLFRRLAAGSP